MGYGRREPGESTLKIAQTQEAARAETQLAIAQAARAESHRVKTDQACSGARRTEAHEACSGTVGPA